MKCFVQQATTGNRLTDAHLFHFSDVAHLYDHQDPTKEDTFQRRADAVAPWFHDDHRRTLVDALTAYGRHIGASEIQLASAARLLAPESVAVVTGQQAGILTGPMLSISKALSAIGLASEMERVLSRPVVPVFWVASEDHDFAEVDRAYFLDKDDVVSQVRLHHRFDGHQMVYHAALTGEQVAGVMDTLQHALPESPSKVELLHTVRRTWSEGDTLSVWFARLMATLLSEHPIVILDPCIPALRALVGPVFANTLASFDAIQNGLKGAYESVEQAGFSPEVIRDETHSTVFHVVNGRRYVLEHRGDGIFSARGLGKSAHLTEWLKEASENATLFSSNVLLRPVIQDHLLPTLTYVGGPSELAYHPLSRAVFHAHGRSLPPLILRQRFRIVSPSVWRTMQKWGIGMEQVRQQTDLVHDFALRDTAESLEVDMKQMKVIVSDAMGSFSNKYDHLGPQVADLTRHQLEKQARLLEKLQTKVYRLAERRRGDEVSQLRRVERWFWTDGHEQERRLCPVNLWAEFGLSWFASLPTWGNFRQPGPVFELVID